MTSLKNNTKILFTDLDGTLFDDQKQICPENRSAIRRDVYKRQSSMTAL